MSRLAFFCALLVAAPGFAVAQKGRLAPLPPALPRTHKPEPTTPEITAADLMTRLYIFADDSMLGRQAGRMGNYKGTTYLASEVKRLGLQPAGDNGTYFQSIPDFPPVIDQSDASMGSGSTTFALRQDFIPIGPHDIKNGTLEVVYGGKLEAPMTLTSEQTRGKLVVFKAPSNGTGIDSALGIPHIDGAVVGLVVLDYLSDRDRTALTNRNIILLDKPSIPVLLLSKAVTRTIFGKGVDSVSVGASGKQVVINYTMLPSARNVVAIIPGSDPVLRNEYIAMGAHNDHIGRLLKSAGEHDSLRVLRHIASIGGAETDGRARPTYAQMDSINAELVGLRQLYPPRTDSIYNGADDDGSGSVSMLEIAEQLAAMPVKPKRSILFVWHTGEEDGLLGSEWFTTHPTVPRDSIVVQLNADMIGRGDASDIPGGGPDFVEVVGARKLSTELGKLIDTLNKQGHHNLALDHLRGDQYYERSDHYMYARYGIPIAFFITDVHPDYHEVTDEPQYIDYPKMARIASFISDVAVHIGNLDHRLVVDHPPAKEPK